MIKRNIHKLTKSLVAFAAASTLLITSVPAYAAPTTDNKDIAATSASNQKYRNVMYYGDWSIWGGQHQFYPKDIPADQLTHLNFAFLDFNAQGQLQFTDKGAAIESGVGVSGASYDSPNSGILNAFQELKNDNPNLKIGVSLGGWSKSGDFSAVTANSSSRATFVKNIMAFIKYTNMDFVDVDWEYPSNVRQPDKCDNKNDEGCISATAADKANYILLLQDLRNALDKQGKELNKTYELSVALPASVSKVDEGIDVAKLFSIVDFANIMTYDMAGAWDTNSGHQAALYTNPNSPSKGQGLSVDESVNYYLSKGAKADKIVIGACYYTRGWEKVSNDGPDKNNPGLFGTAAVVNKDADFKPSPGALNEAPLVDGEGGRCGGVWSYNALSQLKSKYPGLKEYWDDTAKAPYLYNESTGAFFTYDNVKSIQEKVKYVKNNNLGGMIAWMASQDATTTSTKRDELTKATKEALFGSTPLNAYDVTYNPVNASMKFSTSTAPWGTGGILNVSITNNEKLGESGEVLSCVESSAKTIKNAKLYIKTDGIKITGAKYPCPGITEENGYYVIDLSGSYDAKFMKPGQTLTFDLDTSAPLDNVNGIVSVELTQRMYPLSKEANRQTIYGKATDPSVNTAPVINGVSNKSITVGDSFNALAGVTANDKEDGDLTSKIVVTGSVDTSKAGTYNLTYTVADSKGLTTTAKAVVTVADKTTNTAPVLNGISDKTINVGDSFNPLTGITATDKEDGDLTSKISISGSVDTTKIGTYNLIYTVADSKGLTATAKSTITVVNNTVQAYSPSMAYKAGDVVTYNGVKYKAKWWTMGETPGASQWGAWEKVN